VADVRSATPSTLLPSLSPVSSVHHRHLHSFPTRRSSDLAFFSAGTGGRTGLRKDHQAGAVPVVEAPAAEVDAHGAPELIQSRTADRKSTRLNSSHEWISYAVSCLKKNTATVLDMHSYSSA